MLIAVASPHAVAATAGSRSPASSKSLPPRVKALFRRCANRNLPAIRLYHSAGFATTGRRPNYYHHPAEAALLMNLKLTG
jgi:ribosomal protein S18 acetylase RimI-like enzyme